MKVSAQNTTDTGLSAKQHQADAQKSSDRFSQVMKDQKERDAAKEAAAKKNRADAQPAPSSPVNGDASQSLDASAMRMGQPLTTGDTPRTAQNGSSAPPEIHKLAAEMGAHMDLFKQGAANQTMHITFDSKTLDGLQVQIRQQNGEVAIHFMTQSENVSTLLKRHTDELRETLSSKGVKIRNIAVANTAARSALQRGRDA